MPAGASLDDAIFIFLLFNGSRRGRQRYSLAFLSTMSIYEEVEVEDLDYDPATRTYTYPCPCGDKFSITLEELWDGEDIATCPSCTLRIEIIYDEDDLPDLPDSDDEGDDTGEEGAKKEDDGEEKGKDNAGQEEKKEDDDDDGELAKSAQKKLAI